jgi:hypothetical protein
MEINKEKKEMLLSIIAVRLDNVNDVTRRSRLAFIVTTIASCAIIISIWGVYLSTSRNVALYSGKFATQQNQIQNSQQSQPSASAATPSQPNPIILPLHEYNRRELIKEWIKNTNVAIDFLGIEVNINDFPFIGGLGMFVTCFWLFFTFRRENRAIVSLLRDVKNDLNFPEASEKKGDDVWDIANLAFHGVANSLIFFTTGTNDKPLSNKDIFPDPQDKKPDTEDKREEKFDNYIAKLTKFIRSLAMILIFLPAITIFFMIGMDFYSSHYIKSPFRAKKIAESGGNQTSSAFDKAMADEYENLTPNEYLKMNNINDRQITLENVFATAAGIGTLFICTGCFIFQKRTSVSLKEFEKRLKNETSEIDDENNDASQQPSNNLSISETTDKERL